MLLANNSQLSTSFVFSFGFSIEHIGNIKNLGPKKDHELDMISIYMLKLYGDSVNNLISIVFKNCFYEEIF